MAQSWPTGSHMDYPKVQLQYKYGHATYTAILSPMHGNTNKADQNRIILDAKVVAGKNTSELVKTYYPEEKVLDSQMFQFVLATYS